MSAVGRIAAVAAVGVAVLLVGLLLLGRDDDYHVRARFESAAGMVKGNVVQIAGKPVGVVSGIRLAADGQAELDLQIDGRHAPLRQGTQVALRLASLSSPAGRYVDLLMPDGRVRATIPDGGTIDTAHTSSATDLDQIFSVFDARTRRGLRALVRGQAEAYGGRGDDISAGWRYLNPSLVAAQRLFAEVDRDTPLLERFLVAQSRLVGDLADRRDALAQLVDRLATATGAIADQQTSLTRAVGLLPPFLRRSSATFANLRSTLDTAAPLVEEAKPVAPRLREALAQLRPLARDAVPTIRRLAGLVQRSGPRNDLIDLARAVLPLREIAVGPVRRNGAQREGSLPTAAKSLAQTRKDLAFLRPYAVDLVGWFDDFSHSGAYDANGNFSRSAISVNAPSALTGLLDDLLPGGVVATAANQIVRTGQNNRCPGSIERGALWKPTPDFNCDASQGPVGR